MSIPEEDITISYDSGAVIKPVYFYLKKETEGSITTYTPEPENILLKNGITVSIPAGGIGDDDRVGLYHRISGGWILQIAERVNGGRNISATLKRMFGEFTVMRDETPPSIGRVRLSTAGGKLSASFRYHDNLSGVDPDQIKIFVDDGIIIPEIDGEHRRVTCPSVFQ